MRAGDHAARAHRARRSSPALSPGEHVQSIAIAADDVISFRHLFPEARIVGREPIAAVRSLDQEQRLTVAGVQTIYNLFRQDNSKRISEFADFKFDHVITIVITFLSFGKKNR